MANIPLDQLILPPEVQALGRPEKGFFLSGSWEALLWGFCALLLLMGAFFAFALMVPFGTHPPPPVVFLVLLLLFASGGLAMGVYTATIRGEFWLVFPGALVRMKFTAATVLRWEQIAGLTDITAGSMPRYEMQMKDGTRFKLENHIQDVTQLAATVGQRAGVATPGAAAAVFGAPGGTTVPARSNMGLFPVLTNSENARSAGMQGAAAATWCTVSTLAMVLLNMAGVHLIKLDAWALVDVAIFGGIALGIRSMSRAAAVAGLVLFLLERIAMVAMGIIPVSAAGGASIMTLFVIGMFVNGVRGTFAFHKFNEDGYLAAGRAGGVAGDPASGTAVIANPAAAPYAAASTAWSGGGSAAPNPGGPVAAGQYMGAAPAVNPAANALAGRGGEATPPSNAGYGQGYERPEVPWNFQGTAPQEVEPYRTRGYAPSASGFSGNSDWIGTILKTGVAFVVGWLLLALVASLWLRFAIYGPLQKRLLAGSTTNPLVPTPGARPAFAWPTPLPFYTWSTPVPGATFQNPTPAPLANMPPPQ